MSLSKKHTRKKQPTRTRASSVRTLPSSTSLLESEARFQALFATNIIGITLSDLDDTILDANDAFLKIIGYTREDLRSGRLTWRAITPVAYAALDDRKVQEVLRYGRIAPFEKAYVHKRGHLVPVLVGAEMVRTNPPLSVSFALDISHQKKVEQRKDDFVGTVSHELKTPLAVLRIYADLLQHAVLGSGDREEILRTIDEIEGQIGKLTMIINDLATFTKMQIGENEAGKDLFDVSEVLTEVVEEVKMAHDRKIVLKKSRQFSLVRGHQERLKLVFSNLIRNAIRYSPETKPIRVRLASDGKHVIISVKDHGIGIHKKDHGSIFERYYRADHANSYSEEGTGIGLFICKEILQSHRGRISIESALGKGSTFHCYIPMASRPRAAQKKAKPVKRRPPVRVRSRR